jgi:hypothetical protein
VRASTCPVRQIILKATVSRELILLRSEPVVESRRELACIEGLKVLGLRAEQLSWRILHLKTM